MEENENNSAVTRAGLPLKKDVLIRAGFPLKGGEGSGNFGHEGRPGEVGGSGGGGGNSTTTYAETESKPSTDLQPMLDATMPDTRPYKGGYPAEGFKTTDEINEYMRAQPYANGGSLTPKEYISNLQGDPRMANEIAAEVAYMYSGQSGVGRLEVGEGLRLQGLSLIHI